MATVTPVMEETTGTVPFTVIVGGGVNIILTPERRLKASKLDSFGFFRVTPGFGDFVDHA